MEFIKKLDWVLIGAIILLLAIGLLSIASASEARTGVFTIFKKQLIFAVIGVVLLLFFSSLDYRFLRNYPAIILSLYCLLSIVALTLLMSSRYSALFLVISILSSFVFLCKP